MIDPPRVASLHSYPVKSLVGQELSSLEIDQRGCAGDRRWSIGTGAAKIASGKNSRRFEAVPAILQLRAHEQDGNVFITFPDGTTCSTTSAEATDRLTQHLGQPVTLALETEVSHFDDGPVSLIGSASVLAIAHERGEHLDPARFRANVVLDTSEPFLEERWVGRELEIGTAVLSVTMTSPRCVMVDLKTAELPEQSGNLKTIGRVNGANLGVIAKVMTPGTINKGDSVHVR